MDLVLGVVSFTGIVLLLVVVILLARSQLVASGNVSITINGDEENKLEVQTGSKLLQTLADNKILLKELSLNAQNYSKENNWEKYLKKLESLINEKLMIN